MDNIIYESLNKYFKALSKTGYKSYAEVYKLLFLIIADDLQNEFKELLTEDDIRVLSQNVYRMYWTDCTLIPESSCSK